MKKAHLFIALIISVHLLNAQVDLIVLGIAQDAGSPQLGCQKKCCVDRWKTGATERVVSLGIIDRKDKKHYLLEATPNIAQQLYHLTEESAVKSKLKGVFLTHAHMGHYSGLLQFGKEAFGGKNIPVYAAPRFSKFLTTNGPWDQLIRENNIELRSSQPNKTIELSAELTVKSLLVPHRDEYSETVGYLIEGPQKKALFIPDIDKWERWETPIEELIALVDYAFLDATFFDGTELPNRDMNEIPHPFVVESMRRFEQLPTNEKEKVYFIHFNHTNPLLQKNSLESQLVASKGFNVAQSGMKFDL